MYTSRCFSKYVSHAGSYGLASARIFVCRSIRMDEAASRRTTLTCPSSSLRMPVNTHRFGPSLGKYFALHPSARFAPMSATCPFPDRLEYGTVSRVKDRFADHMAVIERPSVYLRIECYVLSCQAVRSRYFDTCPNLAEKCLYVFFLRRGNEELGAFPPAIFAYCLPKEIKPLLDMRDDEVFQVESSNHYNRTLKPGNSMH